MSKIGVLLWRHIFESGDARRLAKQVQDLRDLTIIRDIPYLDDGERGHLLDRYERPGLPDQAPVLINIHGGGLFASYKEVNANFNYEWARLGYRVISLSYRRIPETTVWHQIDDVMAALCFLKEHAAEQHLNLEQCVLVGDSAGALLGLFALGINGSRKLQEDFGISAAGFSVRSAGFVSVMLDTRRRDPMCAINSVITEKKDRGKPYEKYLLNPALLLRETVWPPLFLVTSAQDLIEKDTVKLERLLQEQGIQHELLRFPKGKERKLVHVFSVMYPMYPESRQVYEKMHAYFCEKGGIGALPQ